MSFRLSVCLAAALALSACAAADDDIARVRPADPAAAISPTSYEPLVKSYSRYREPSRLGWKQTNDEMRRLGGIKGQMGDAANDE